MREGHPLTTSRAAARRSMPRNWTKPRSRFSHKVPLETLLSGECGTHQDRRLLSGFQDSHRLQLSLTQDSHPDTPAQGPVSSGEVEKKVIRHNYGNKLSCGDSL